MAVLPFIAAAAGAAGSLGKGIASADAAGYQAQIASNNAIIAKQSATYSAQAGAADIEDSGLKERAQGADVRAAAAANGVDVNSGSSASVQTSQREIGALDTATVANKAALQVYGYQNEATSFQAQAQLDKAQEAPDILGGVLGAVGDLAGSSQFTSLLSSGSGGGSSVPSAYSWMSAPTANANVTMDSDWDAASGGAVPY